MIHNLTILYWCHQEYHSAQTALLDRHTPVSIFTAGKGTSLMSKWQAISIFSVVGKGFIITSFTYIFSRYKLLHTDIIMIHFMFTPNRQQSFSSKRWRLPQCLSMKVFSLTVSSCRIPGPESFFFLIYFPYLTTYMSPVHSSWKQNYFEKSANQKAMSRKLFLIHTRENRFGTCAVSFVPRKEIRSKSPDSKLPVFKNFPCVIKTSPNRDKPGQLARNQSKSVTCFFFPGQWLENNVSTLPGKRQAWSACLIQLGEWMTSCWTFRRINE